MKRILLITVLAVPMHSLIHAKNPVIQARQTNHEMSLVDTVPLNEAHSVKKTGKTEQIYLTIPAQASDKSEHKESAPVASAYQTAPQTQIENKEMTPSTAANVVEHQFHALVEQQLLNPNSHASVPAIVEQAQELLKQRQHEFGQLISTLNQYKNEKEITKWADLLFKNKDMFSKLPVQTQQYLLSLKANKQGVAQAVTALFNKGMYATFLGMKMNVEQAIAGACLKLGIK